MVHLEPWLATSRFGPKVEPPTGDHENFLIHARTLGTTKSACGQEASSWFKHWDSFHAVTPGRKCPTCLELVGRDPRGLATRWDPPTGPPTQSDRRW